MTFISNIIFKIGEINYEYRHLFESKDPEPIKYKTFKVIYRGHNNTENRDSISRVRSLRELNKLLKLLKIYKTDIISIELKNEYKEMYETKLRF